MRNLLYCFAFPIFVKLYAACMNVLSIIVVTGASTGIGNHAAITLAKEGYHVLSHLFMFACSHFTLNTLRL